MAEPEFLKLLQHRFPGRSTATSARLSIDGPWQAMAEALEMLRAVVPTSIQGKTAVPRLEASRTIGPEEQVAMAVSVSKAVRLKMRDMAELEREAPVAELQHKTPVAEATEVPRLEVSVLAEEAAMEELKAMMRPMKFCTCVR